MQAQKVPITTLPREVLCIIYRGGSKAAATFKMERFVVIVNGFQPLNIM